MCVAIFKEVASFWGLGQLWERAIEHVLKLYYRPAERKKLVAYIELELIAVLPEIYSKFKIIQIHVC